MNNPTDKKIFYTYSNGHAKMSEEYMYKYRDSLVFDRLRRSIFAQQNEFGYISNIDSTINFSDLSLYSSINLNIDKGYVSFTYTTPDTTIPESNFLVTKILYNDLKNLCENGELLENHFYEIVDYETTSSKANTGVGGHHFNIVVKANSKYELDARATAKIGKRYALLDNELTEIDNTDNELYWNNSVLSKWELLYDIKNDTNRYDWADAENGKGVIYWLKDEFENEANYDFKNIYWYGIAINIPENSNLKRDVFPTENNSKVYTFCLNNNVDASIYGYATKIKIISGFRNKYILNKILLKIPNSLYYTSNITIEDCSNFYLYSPNYASNNYFCNCLNMYIGLLEVEFYNAYENIIASNKFLNSHDIATGEFLSSNNIDSVFEANIFGMSNEITNSNNLFITGNRNFVLNSSNIFNNTHNIVDFHDNIIINSKNFTAFSGIIEVNKIHSVHCDTVSINKSFIYGIDMENCNDIVITSNLTTSSTNKIQNIKLYPGIKSKAISVPELNNDYLIEYKSNETREYII